MFVARIRFHSCLRPGRALQAVTAVSAALLPALAGASPWGPDPNIMLPDSNYVSQKIKLIKISKP